MHPKGWRPAAPASPLSPRALASPPEPESDPEPAPESEPRPETEPELPAEEEPESEKEPDPEDALEPELAVDPESFAAPLPVPGAPGPLSAGGEAQAAKRIPIAANNAMCDRTGMSCLHALARASARRGAWFEEVADDEVGRLK